MQSGHLRNFFSCGAMQAMQLLPPLVAIPWLGRVLGPDAFGLLMYMAIIPPVVFLVMDWGMGIGAVRLCAKARGDLAELRAITGAVFSAKITLAIACAVICALVLPLVPHASQYPLAYWLAVALGFFRGINPLWFYQGTGEGLGKIAIWDVISSTCALALIFLFIRAPQDWQLYLLFIAAGKGVPYVILNCGLWRSMSPDLSAVSGFRLLLKTRTLFASSLCIILYNNGSQLVLGYFLPAAQMGLLVAIHKMLRAMVSITLPFTQIILPEVCAFREQKPESTRKMLRLSVIGLTGLTAFLATAIFFLAPHVLSLALGPQFVNGSHALKIMIMAAPFMACSQVLGTQILAAHNQEKAQVAVQAIIGVASLAGAPLLAMSLGLEGGAFLPVCVEAGLTLGYLAAVFKLCPGALWKKAMLL